MTTASEQWQAIIAVKVGPCRVCCGPSSNGRLYGVVQFHHVVARYHSGDDVADNIVPLCERCYRRVTIRCEAECRALLASLSDAEYAYMIERGGEDYAGRAYGVRYTRP